MAANSSLDKKLDDVLERLNYLGMVIRNLKDRDGTLLTDVGEIDERLFKEIASYELLTEELKKDFVMLITEDAKKLATACVNNIDIFDKTLQEFKKIDGTLDFIGKHEAADIEKSRELQELAMDARDELSGLKKDMNERVRGKREEKTEYEQTQAMHRSMR